jgi:hypothetical protein
METVNTTYDIRTLAGNRPAKLILMPHTDGNITYDDSNPHEVVFTAPVDSVWRNCSQAATKMGFDQERGSSRFPYEFFQAVELSTVVAYASSRPFDYDPAGQDPVSNYIAQVDAMDSRQWYAHASADGQGNTMYKLGDGKRVIKQPGQWILVDDKLTPAFFRDVASIIRPDGEIQLEEFIGPGGFSSVEQVYQVLDAAGLVLTGYEQISAAYQTNSAVIRKNLRTNEYGQALRLVIHRIQNDDDNGSNGRKPAPQPKPQPEDKLQPVFA